MDKKMKTPKEIIGMVDMNALMCMKKVLVLKGYRDDGKTSTLKELIRQVNELYPNTWCMRGKYSAEKYDVKTLVDGVKYGDRSAVFKINGVVVVIHTAGDNPSAISRTFTIAAKYRAQIVVMALKVNDGEKSRAQIAFEEIRQSVSCEFVEFDIRGRRLRTFEVESEFAETIVSVISRLVNER